MSRYQVSRRLNGDVWQLFLTKRTDHEKLHHLNLQLPGIEVRTFYCVTQCHVDFFFVFLFCAACTYRVVSQASRGLRISQVLFCPVPPCRNRRRSRTSLYVLNVHDGRDVSSLFSFQKTSGCHELSSFIRVRTRYVTRRTVVTPYVWLCVVGKLFSSF